MVDAQHPADTRVTIYDATGTRVADTGWMYCDEEVAEVVFERPLVFPPGSSMMWWSRGLPKDEIKLPEDMVALTACTFGPPSGPKPSTSIRFADT